MIQKAKRTIKSSKPTKVSKPGKKLTSTKTKRLVGNAKPIPKSRAIDEAYDRGYNDGYSKGLEDGGLDESS